jgi:hypothetical protein
MSQNFTGFKTSPGFIDETNNTWSCLRSLRTVNRTRTTGNSLFCAFWEKWEDVDDPHAEPYFFEFYNVEDDCWQLNNTAAALSSEEHSLLWQRLQHLRHCKGASNCV